MRGGLHTSLPLRHTLSQNIAEAQGEIYLHIWIIIHSIPGTELSSVVVSCHYSYFGDPWSDF
jgi:hypothetical protein